MAWSMVVAARGGGGGARRWWRRGARTQRPEGPSLPGLADRHTCPIAALRHTTWLGLITIPRGSFFLELFLDGQAQWWYVRSIQHSQRCTSTTGDRLADDHGGGWYAGPPGQRPWWRMVPTRSCCWVDTARRAGNEPRPTWRWRSPTDLISYPSVQYLARRDTPPLPVAPNRGHIGHFSTLTKGKLYTVFRGKKWSQRTHHGSICAVLRTRTLKTIFTRHTIT